MISPRSMASAYVIFLLMLCIGKALAAPITVELPNQGTELYYSEAVRLSQVLIDAQRVEPERFVLANHFALLDKKSDMTAEKKNIFGQLEQRASKPNNESLNQSSQAILDQLKQFTYLRRLPYRLDADWARSQIATDPVLAFQNKNAGLRFRLLQSKRPTQIRLMGAIEKPTLMPFKPHWKLSDYIENHHVNLLSGAQKSLAFVIQPDGEMTQLPYGWWNGKEVYFAPGATIFIGLRSLAWENEELNLKIVELLTHKVGL
ncbi:hypothetical protein FCV82_01245 [Vibrio breoganii]|uniref:capsule biosynthesis GfcC family protein n=1 Tax=Vibrio breoganii TaxID=553239 RepID=UPI0010BD40C7|nr:capsule biosynthesis GfcC family protein [Vibrio breoganii]TKF90869.1 hypothetical protein FCV82_01245 [Vibrio breoganii]